MAGEMKKIDNKAYIWNERYRPSTIHDVIIPDKMRTSILEWINTDGEIPNLGLFGNTPGLGKTSIAKAIINDLDADAIFINASKDNGIDMVRNKIQSYASTKSFDGTTKIVIMDEFDGTSAEMQKSFRGSIEEYSKNCRFILTANYNDKIIEPILNRLSNYNLDNIFAVNKAELAKQIYDRLIFILNNEKVEYSVADVKTLIGMFYPSIREMINVIQQSVEDGKLTVNYTAADLNKIYIGLLDAIKDKDYERCRILSSQVISPTGFYKFIYKHLDTLFINKSIPMVVVNLHHFMTSNINARDPEISIAAFCAKLMITTDIKLI